MNQQRRTGQQQQGERQFTRDQRRAQAILHAAHSGAPAAFLQDALEVALDRSKRRSRTRQQRAEDRGAEREEQDAAVEASLLQARDPRRAQADERVDPPRCDRQAGGGRHTSNHEALHQQLPEDPSAAGAKRGADRDLSHPGGAACQQQVRHVGARDQEDDDDRAEKNEEPRPVIADELLHQGHDLKGQFLIVLGKLPAQLLCYTHDVGVGLLLRGVVLQSSVDREVVLVVRGFSLRRERRRHPQLL